MKKLIAFALALACVLGLCSCDSKESPNQGADPMAYAFEAQYIRTNGYSENTNYPYHVVINSKEEFETYYETNKEVFDLERKEKVYSDTTIGFWDACDKYDDSYFERQNVVLIVLEEGSGSIRHEITDVRPHSDENGAFVGWDITINRIVPEVGTDDMAQWHLLLEVQAGDVIKSDDDVWINGKLSTKVDANYPIGEVPLHPLYECKTGYFIPDYDTTNNLHCDEFLKILKSDGYIRGGEKDYNYNTDNITRIVNITPKSVSDETSDIEVFCVGDIHCFLMVNHTIYRYDTFGGYHHQLCLWDYDSNGTKDLVSYNTSGSGLSYMSVGIFDLTSFKEIQVITRMILNEPGFSFECKNGVIYIDGEELTYSNGSFHCNSFNKDAQ